MVPGSVRDHDGSGSTECPRRGWLSDRLYDFLQKHLERNKLKQELAACREGNERSVICLSSALRHIFAHGHLSAHSNGISPHKVDKACEVVSEFLLTFMGTDFTARIHRYEQYEKGAPGQRTDGSESKSSPTQKSQQVKSAKPSRAS